MLTGLAMDQRTASLANLSWDDAWVVRVFDLPSQPSASQKHIFVKQAPTETESPITTAQSYPEAATQSHLGTSWLVEYRLRGVVILKLGRTLLGDVRLL